MGYAEWFEGFGIAFAVFLATFVSTYSEYKNEGSFRDLQEQASRVRNNVFRDGRVVTLPVTEVVLGYFVSTFLSDKCVHIIDTCLFYWRCVSQTLIQKLFVVIMCSFKLETRSPQTVPLWLATCTPARFVHFPLSLLPHSP